MKFGEFNDICSDIKEDLDYVIKSFYKTDNKKGYNFKNPNESLNILFNIIDLMLKTKLLSNGSDINEIKLKITDKIYELNSNNDIRHLIINFEDRKIHNEYIINFKYNCKDNNYKDEYVIDNDEIEIIKVELEDYL